MIDLYYWTTPNGHKITMFLEETGLPYRIVPVNINTGAQFDPAFLAIAPNNRIPAIVDHDARGGGAPLSVFESGAILLYLAEKTGRLLPPDLHGRIEVIQWLFWQVAGLGPMAGQNHHFSRYAPEPIPYAIERYQRIERVQAEFERALAKVREDKSREAGDRPILKVTTRGLGGEVEIRVRDNGTGIPPESRDRLFQPFFTTKPTGEGTGLGLSISYDIVTQQHGGTISVDSQFGAFTEFTVRLPRRMHGATTGRAA